MGYPRIGIGVFVGTNSGGGETSDFDILYNPFWGQSNGTSRFTISGNLPAGQQGSQTGLYNWAYNSGTPQFQAYESGVNDSYGTSVVINGSTTDYTNQTGQFSFSNSIGYKMYNTYGIPCYFNSSCVGGTGLDASFTPLTWDSGTADNLYDEAVTRTLAGYAALKAANPTARIKIVLTWIQGETDAFTSSTTANNYEANLTALINQARIDLAAGDSDFTDVDFVVTSLRANTIYYPYRDTVQRAQVAVAINLDNVYLHYMNTDRTPLSPDYEHYTPTSASYVGELGAVNAGEDLADAYWQLYNTVVNTGYVQYLGVNTSISGDYKYVNFETHGVLKVLSNGGTTIDNVLVVAGGGSGGSGGGTDAGGGAGGQVKPLSSYSVSVSGYPVYIGDGGAAAVDSGGAHYQGYNGSPSTFNLTTALGGGYGGGYNNEGANSNNNGGAGGNGGGGANYITAGSAGVGTDFNGGTTLSYPTGKGGGGGGGANEAGSNGSALGGGDGGDGYLWVDGNYYGGGGGGSASTGFTRGLGGLGGGGNGQERDTLLQTNGTDGLGGGGGGISSSSGIGGIGSTTTGGKGIVKLRVKFQN